MSRNFKIIVHTADIAAEIQGDFFGDLLYASSNSG